MPVKVIVLAALTIDGKLARTSSQLVTWTSREDKRIFFDASKRAGVLIMGNNTFRTLTAPLRGRLHVVLTRTPAAHTGTAGVVEYTDRPPGAILASLEERGYTEAVLGGGSQVNALFLASGLIDELWVTVEPLIFGEGVDLFSGAPFDIRARLLEFERLNDEGAIFLKYALKP
jgi:dihydrofolate reductase